MEERITWLLLVCAVCLSQSCHGSSFSVVSSSQSSFRIELLLDNIKNSQNQMTHELTQIEETLQKQNSLLEKLSKDMERVLGSILTIANNTSKPQCHESEIQKPHIEDCASAERSGRQKLKCESCQTAATVYCEMDKFNGGWLVIQQRLDGSENFRRSWTEYRNGFGTVGNSTEFWLGLELIHQITNSGGDYELAIELKDHNGVYGYGRYSDFKIAGEDEKYRLSQVGGYSGTIGDNLSSARGSQFFSFDQDDATKCLDTYFSGGGWWSRGCFVINLNGAYIGNAKGYGISWYGFSATAKYSRMLIRRKTLL